MGSALWWILGGVAVVGVGAYVYSQNQASAAAGTQPVPPPTPGTNNSGLANQVLNAAGTAAQSAGSGLVSDLTGT